METSNKRKILKVSKNRKKTWRKHTDIKDIEEFLEDQRFNERIGGAISERPDDEIFLIEKTTKRHVDEEERKQNKKVKKLIKKKNKAQEIFLNLSCFNKLQSTSKVTPIKAKSGPKNKKLTLLDDDKKLAKKWPAIEKGIELSKKISEDNEKIKLGLKSRFQVYDIWNDDDDGKDGLLNNENNNDDIKELDDIRLTLIRAKPPKIPSHRYKKPSLLPQVEVPHPGTSYNPSFEDHQELIKKANEVEMKKLKEEMHLQCVLDDKFPTADKAPNKKTWLKEMSQGLGLKDEEKEGDDDNDDEIEKESDKVALIKSKTVDREKKKTKAQRNKELRLKYMKLFSKNKKLSKKFENQFFKLKNIKKEIKLKEKLSQEKQKRKSQRLKEKLFKPSKLSKYKYEDPNIELNLSDELTGTLRGVKIDGNLLEDRFKSLQRRNIIEVRAPQSRKNKYKPKFYERKNDN